MATNRMTLKWNTPAQCWVLDVADQSGTPIAQGIAIVTGADLLEQLQYLGLGGQMIAQTDHDTDAVPTFENLGNEGHLYFLAS